MSEKIVREFQIIETDDGFRIEIKGDDKEQLRKLLFSERDGDFSFPWGRRKRFGRRHAPAPFMHPMPPMPPQPPMPPHEHHQHHEHHERGFRGRGRRFGGRWEARGGYDLGPWWDEGAFPPDDPADRSGDPPTQA